jgi:hypothetical protein
MIIVGPRHRWEDNIKIDLKERLGKRGMVWSLDRDKWQAVLMRL